MARIVIAERVAAEGLALLSDAGHELFDLSGATPEALREALATADALVVRSQVRVDAALIAAALHLRVIGRAGVGTDNIDGPAAAAREITVVNAPSGNTIAAAEHTMALLLGIARNIAPADRSMRDGAWERKALQGFELSGKSIGIVGFGRVGRAVATRAAAFGMIPLAHDPVVGAAEITAAGVTPLTLNELLARADVVTLHAPAARDAAPLIGAREIALMRRNAVLINVARGALVEEAALAAALASGAIAGAAIDVFNSEPPVGSPLLSAPRTLLTPHLGASTAEAQVAVAVEMAERMILALSETRG
ncbi:MAG: hydroxyacid dehydrogenase [Candidatus Limnocylindrus sp.]